MLTHDPVTGDWTSPADDAESTASIAALTSAGDAPQSPSYLAWHPDGRHLYAVGEVADGRVWAYEIDDIGGARRTSSVRRPPAANSPAIWPSTRPVAT